MQINPRQIGDSSCILVYGLCMAKGICVFEFNIRPLTILTFLAEEVGVGAAM